MALQLLKHCQGNGKGKQVFTELFLQIIPRREVGQADHRPGMFRQRFPVGVNAKGLAARGIGNHRVFIAFSSIIGQNDEGGKLIRIGKENNDLRPFFFNIHVLQGFKNHIPFRNLHDGQVVEKILDKFRRFNKSLAMKKVIQQIFVHKRRYLLCHCASHFRLFIAR